MIHTTNGDKCAKVAITDGTVVQRVTAMQNKYPWMAAFCIPQTFLLLSYYAPWRNISHLTL